MNSNIRPTDSQSQPGGTRRSFLRGGVVLGAATLGTGLLNITPAFASSDHSAPPSKGDVDILRFLTAIEIIETDLWQQYNELGGIQDGEVPGGSGNKTYTAALANLDEDMDQYIHDNTDDEISHFTFLNAYVESLGGSRVSLEEFRTLPSSQADGAQKTRKRITNLMRLTVNTGWWTRYRSDTGNPDAPFGDKFTQAVPTLAVGEHPGIPRDNADTASSNRIQAIANTAAFHFAWVEQGGTSLYPALAQRVRSAEVLRVLLSIGGTEIMHFQTWSDKAGAAVSPPFNVTDGGLVFPDLSSAGEALLNNLIMPEPTVFLRRRFPKVSIIRPTETEGAAMGTVKAFTDDGLFRGQSQAFFTYLNGLAAAADRARR